MSGPFVDHITYANEYDVITEKYALVSDEYETSYTKYVGRSEGAIADFLRRCSIPSEPSSLVSTAFYR